jgi:lipopolysaccharide transport system ATP-binding protein
MTDIAIHVENLSKEYKIVASRQRYETLRDQIARGLGRLVRRNGRSNNPSGKFLALRDVCFDVNQGEVVGIIGRNGSGKSTLLKILSRITEPSTGMAKLNGRLGSLLEVGTGFHSELTGRENVYLNAAILGMRRTEIDRKFDAIVEFAGVEQFIDTPVKHYSSGMSVRLAFAVAAHLDLEILLLDEVLAVGDLEFQKKCLGKMGEVAKGGRTILFVSHQMNQIRRLCERVIWLDAGCLRRFGSTADVVGAYEATMTAGRWDESQRTADAHRNARFLRWEIVEPRSDQPNVLTSLGPVTVKFVVETRAPVRRGHHGISLFNADGQLMWGWAADNVRLSSAANEFYYTFPTLPLRPGVYSWHVSLYGDAPLHGDQGLLDEWHCQPPMIIATEIHQHRDDKWNGLLNVPCRFSVNGVQ